ncbi:hypothetical protein T484DRAFT_1934113 [Baffinella frigidus]|nr:hypothetical protein T484DRAFT_1934113 [Cryptophyta sp. CCMP2293]
MPRGTCDFYMREGKCMLGETCRFRHAGRPQARPLLRAIASILREEEYAVGKGAATNREGKQVSRTGKGEARMLINKLGQRSSGWELAETRVQRLLLSVVGRTKPRAPQRQPPVDWEAWTAEHT